MQKIFPQKFFNRPTLEVAKDLLGKVLIRKIGNKKISLIITEVEAYDGFKDKASHASRGKTERNKIMFEQAGCFYVYFTYGMHNMLNIVTGPKNYPAAILIRAGVIKQNNIKTIKQSDNKTIQLYNYSTIVLNGPARLTKFLKIDKKFNNLRATLKNNLWFEDHGIKIKLHPADDGAGIIAKKRIGVDYAGKTWANKKWNFSIVI